MSYDDGLGSTPRPSVPFLLRRKEGGCRGGYTRRGRDVQPHDDGVLVLASKPKHDLACSYRQASWKGQAVRRSGPEDFPWHIGSRRTWIVMKGGYYCDT